MPFIRRYKHLRFETPIYNPKYYKLLLRLCEESYDNYYNPGSIERLYYDCLLSPKFNDIKHHLISDNSISVLAYKVSAIGDNIRSVPEFNLWKCKSYIINVLATNVNKYKNQLIFILENCEQFHADINSILLKYIKKYRQSLLTGDNEKAWSDFFKLYPNETMRCINNTYYATNLPSHICLIIYDTLVGLVNDKYDVSKWVSPDWIIKNCSYDMCILCVEKYNLFSHIKLDDYHAKRLLYPLMKKNLYTLARYVVPNITLPFDRHKSNFITEEHLYIGSLYETIFGFKIDINAWGLNSLVYPLLPKKCAHTVYYNARYSNNFDFLNITQPFTKNIIKESDSIEPFDLRKFISVLKNKFVIFITNDSTVIELTYLIYFGRKKNDIFKNKYLHKNYSNILSNIMNTFDINDKVTLWKVSFMMMFNAHNNLS